MEGETRGRPEPVSVRTPVFRDIAVSNVTIDGAKQLIDIDGLPEEPIQGLHIHDVMGSGKAGLTANYTDGLEFHDVQLEPSAGPAFIIQHAANLEFDDIGTGKPACTDAGASSGILARRSCPQLQGDPGYGCFSECQPR